MNDLKKKIVAIATVATVAFGLMGPGIAGAVTAEELQAQINTLMEQLSALQAQLAGLEGEEEAVTGEVPAACVGVTFDRNLKQGMSGSDVKCLQALLNTDAATKVADSGAGSPGNETAYFGPLTKAAAIKFQEKYASDVLAPWGISVGTGFFGSTSRAKANELLAAMAEVPAEEEEEVPAEEEEEEEVSAVGFKAMVADDSPAAGTLGASSAYNTVLKAKIEAGEAAKSITSVTVERFGLSVDTNVDGVLVVDKDGNRHGNVVTFADNVTTISFSADPIEIAAGKSTVISIQLHMDSAATAGTLGLKITGISGDPDGLPLTSNLFTLTATTGVLGSVTVDVVSQTTTTVSVDIGTTDYLLTKFRFVAGANENVKITKLVLFQNGTAADTDLKNFDLVDPDGNVLATVEEAVNKVVTFNLGESYTIAKGTQRDLSVRVDVVSGSSRTGQLIIQNDYDVVVKGVSTGLGILVTAAGTIDTAIPIGDIASGSAGYNHLTVAAGTLTLNKSATSPSGTFGIGAANVTLAVWELEAKGEDIQIQRADLAIGGTTEENDFAGTVKLMTEAGQVIYSTAAPTAATNFLIDGDAAGTDSVTFATYYTITGGTILKLKLVVDASSSVTDAETAIGQISNIYYKRMTSNTYGTASSGTYVDGNTLTASAASLTVTNNAAYGATTVIEGQSNVLLGSYLVQTGSSQGVNVSSINVDINLGGSAAVAALSNMKLKRADTGAQLGSTTASPAATNTFTVSGQLNIPANTTVQVDVYVNMSTAASDGGTDDTYTTDIDANEVSGVGATSGTTAQAPSAVVTGRQVTAVESGSLSVAMDSGVASQFYAAGATGVEMAKVKLSATVEDMKVQRLVLSSINGTGNIANVKLLGTGLASDPSVPMTAGEAVFTFSSGSEIVVPAYGDRVLTAVVDTTGVGTIVAANHGVLGWGTADAIGSGSGVITQESLTGTSYVAGTNAYSAVIGDVIYFTVTADAGTNTAAGFYMVTTTEASVNLATGDLDLEDEATDTSWTAGDIITELTSVEAIAGDANAGTAYDVGEVVYLYDSDNDETGWAIVTTAVASGSTITGLGFSPAGNIAIDVAGDRVTLFTNDNALYGNTVRYEEVEPTITVNTNSPSGALGPSSDQVVAVFGVKADGSRTMTFNSLTIDKAGSNNPERYVTDFSLWRNPTWTGTSWSGGTRIARVANTSVAGSTAAGVTNADTILNLCSGTSDTAGEIGDITQAEADTLKVGDRMVIVDGTNTNTVTINSISGSTIAACSGGVPQTGYVITYDGTVTIAASATVTFRNFSVHFDASQAQTNDVALAEQSITAGQTMTLAVRANTASVRTGVTSGTVTFGVSIPGSAGPLQVATTEVEGLQWDYTPLGTGTAVYKTEGDSYPVVANTLTY